MQCIEEHALADDELIPKRERNRRQDQEKAIITYAKIVPSRLILKLYFDVNNERAEVREGSLSN
jgi:hypothetical protein